MGNQRGWEACAEARFGCFPVGLDRHTALWFVIVPLGPLVACAAGVQPWPAPFVGPYLECWQQRLWCRAPPVGSRSGRSVVVREYERRS